jgi:hypothetical protein
VGLRSFVPPFSFVVFRSTFLSPVHFSCCGSFHPSGLRVALTRLLILPWRRYKLTVCVLP